jgi:excisionase family DNA binding protein
VTREEHPTGTGRRDLVDELTWTQAEVARAFRMSTTTIRELVLRGELPAVRYGRTWRFPRKAAERWLEENAVAHAQLAPEPQDVA